MPWTCVIEEFNGEDIVGTFYKRMKRITKEKSKFRVWKFWNLKEFTIEKVIKKIGDKLYVKGKGYDN